MSARFALLWIALLCSTCTSERDPLRVVIEVESDLTVPAELDRVTLRAEGQRLDGEAQADLRSKPLPRTITLEHAAGPLGPVRVTVLGFLGTRLLQRQERLVWFSEEETEHTVVVLTRDCLGVLCETGDTCSAGACISTPDGPLPTSDAGTEPDASAPDAATGDAGVRDGGTRDAGDAGRDASPGSDGGGANDGGSTTDGGPTTDGGATPDSGTPPPGARPTCTIDRPVPNDVYQVDTTVRLRGTCVDPETGPLTALRWTIERDGQIALGGDTTAIVRTVGPHTITLCAPDPRAGAVLGCTSVAIVITQAAQPAATITSLTQASNANPPFTTGPPIMLTGTGTGNSVVLTWRDSVQGALGTGGSVSLPSPVAGAHTVTLTVRDRDGNEATRSTTFVVLGRPRMGPP